MKKVFTICAAVLLTVCVFLPWQAGAQSPEKMSYQAVIRDAGNNLVTSQAIGMQISILQGSASGTAVYVETQTPTTNENGLVSIEIGSGTVQSGSFATIDWSNGPYFIKTETDPTGGSSYTITGTSQFLSVPYALHAKTAETITGTITESDPIFGASVASGITSTNISNWDAAYGWGNHATAGYLTSFTESDPIFGASAASGITSTNISNWDAAYGWGNHATAGYLTSFTESDPIFGASAANGITSTNILNWNTAFGWGNHAGLYRPISYVPDWGEITSNPFSFNSPLNDQILKYNSTSGKWENWTPTYLTAEVDGSVTNEIELPPQAGNSGKFLTTDGTSSIWATITKSTIGLGNVENTALSTWTGSTNLTTLGTISSGTWQGTLINASYIGNLPASQITSGVFDNARINWAAPGNIGTTTPASGAFTSLSANNGLSVSNGTVNIKPSGSGGTNGQVLTTDGAGNATWRAVPTSSLSVSTQNADYTITASDGFIITNGTCTFTLPTAASAGAGKCIYLYSKVSAITLMPPAGNTLWDANGVSHANPSTITTYNGVYISDGVSSWFEIAK